MTLRTMHPRKTAMMPNKIHPEMERSTLLFKTTDKKKQNESEKEFEVWKLITQYNLSYTHEGSWSWKNRSFLNKMVYHCDCPCRCTCSAYGHSGVWLYVSQRAADWFVPPLWTCYIFVCLNFQKVGIHTVHIWMHLENFILLYILPCVVPHVLAFLHPTFEDQGVSGENLWPAS